MSNFFDSDIIQQELSEIHDLQKQIYGSVLRFPQMPKDEKLDHIEKLTSLLEKQRIMYTRLSLSDDPSARVMASDRKKVPQWPHTSFSIDNKLTLKFTTKVWNIF